ncbi:hypothetical protein [uncultured Dokdonia sp.]|nr:hypothetical protein [uncultured Dokdonia sp.]
MIEENRKFKRTTEQSTPTNPTGSTDVTPKEFDINRDTIKDGQSKK